MSTVESIIDSFGQLTNFGRACGFRNNPGPRAWNMRQRGRIPALYWPSLLAAARDQGIPLTMEMLFEAEITAHTVRRDRRTEAQVPA